MTELRSSSAVSCANVIGAEVSVGGSVGCSGRGVGGPVEIDAGIGVEVGVASDVPAVAPVVLAVVVASPVGDIVAVAVTDVVTSVVDWTRRTASINVVVQLSVSVRQMNWNGSLGWPAQAVRVAASQRIPINGSHTDWHTGSGDSGLLVALQRWHEAEHLMRSNNC